MKILWRIALGADEISSDPALSHGDEVDQSGVRGGEDPVIRRADKSRQE